MPEEEGDHTEDLFAAEAEEENQGTSTATATSTKASMK